VKIPDFLLNKAMITFKEFIEGVGSDTFQRRLRQFTAASQGVKGAITDDRSQVPIYHPPATQQDQQRQAPIQWVQLRDGFYEQMSPQDEMNGLTTLSRFDSPAKDGSYYSRRKDGRFIIVRPNSRLQAINRQ
jgi:hypothetical protein